MMESVQELLEQARALGRAIASHPRVQAFMTAREKVEKDSACQELLKAYSTQARRIRQLEAERRPIEVADKRKLAEFEQKMAGNEALKQLMRVQADYIELMNQVNQAMEAPLATPAPGAPAA